MPINPELGISLFLPAVAVIVIGTIGSIPGVIIGAFIIGFVRALSDPILIGAGNALDRPTASGFAEVMPFIFLIGVLLLAPKGIGHAFQNWNIERGRKRLPPSVDKTSTHDIDSFEMVNYRTRETPYKLEKFQLIVTRTSGLMGLIFAAVIAKPLDYSKTLMSMVRHLGKVSAFV